MSVVTAMNAMKARILSVGLTAPGLVDFETLTQMALAGQTPDTSAALVKYSPLFLPANERRRTTPTIKLALKTAEDALIQYHQAWSNADSITDLALPVLFVSKDGDTFISARMCQAVSEAEPMISPTQFHNSVHNAPAGYWMIGQQNQAPASAISVGDYAIANGLLEAILQSQRYGKPVLMVVYDLPLDELMPVTEAQKSQLPFAFSMVLDASVLAPEAERGCPQLSLYITPQASPTSVVKGHNPYAGVPAAEAYPLLRAIALFEREAELFEMHFPLNRNNSIKVSLE